MGRAPHRFMVAAAAGVLTVLLGPSEAPGQVIGRASVATGGGQAAGGDSLHPAISADSRFVAFDSAATNLVPGDTNALRDVFAYDRVTGTTTRVSVATGGAQATGGTLGSAVPGIGADGRFVTFASDATDLVPGDTNGVGDIFVHDRLLATTTRVSLATGGGEAIGGESLSRSSITADGRLVVFDSKATNLGCTPILSPNPGEGAISHVYLHDRTLLTTTCLTGGLGGGQDASISPDGRFVTFSRPGPAVPLPDPQSEVYVLDRQVGTFSLVGIGDAATMSADSRLVVFAAPPPPGTDIGCDVGPRNTVLTDRTTGNTVLVSGNSDIPVISADGRFIAYLFFPNQIRVLDRSTGVVNTVSVASSGTPANGSPFCKFLENPPDPTLPAGGLPGISGDGQIVVFDTDATNLVPGDTNARTDVFITRNTVTLPALDRDRRADITVMRPTTGEWLVRRSADGTTATTSWGQAGDIPVAADYDGDGQGDVAVYRPSTGQWFVLLSGGGLVAVTWGDPAQNDLPTPADFDGDGRADLAVYRGATGQWFVLLSGGGAIILTWGDPAQLDVPAPADFDGDGRADVTVYRGTTGQWFALLSGGGAAILTWGDPAQSDAPVPGQYDADGRADFAVYRGTTGQWFVLNSGGGGATILTWGDPRVSDVPVPGDYDGDGRTDIAVYRPPSGQWFVLLSGGGATIVSWGNPAVGDQPAPLR